MITVETTGAALASVRFALSPLMEIGTVLNQYATLARRGGSTGWTAAARDTVVTHDLRLMGSFMSGDHGYVPDFLNPEPAGYDPDLRAELHDVATAATDRVRAEMTEWLRRAGSVGGGAAAVTTPVRRFLDRGEDVFAQRVADELARFWTGHLAQRWTGIARALDRDVERRWRLAGRTGLAAVLDGLHPGIRWSGDRLLVESPHRSVRQESRGLVLMPSTFAGRPGVGFDPLGVRRVHIVYPAAPASPQPRRELAGVLGHTRAALLGDLAAPATTTDLARRHHLSPATVSYHLGRLLRAGLVERTRAGNRVEYRRTRP